MYLREGGAFDDAPPMKVYRTTLVFIALILFPVLSSGEPAEGGKVTTLKLIDGDSITGRPLQVKDGSLPVMTDYGVIRVPVAKLSAASKKELDIVDSIVPTSSDNAGSAAKVKELEALVTRLRDENSALRKQIAGQAPPAVVPQPALTHPAVAPGATPTPAAASGFWISGTGKRHNQRCRYYGTGAGHSGSASEGVACKICGG